VLLIELTAPESSEKFTKINRESLPNEGIQFGCPKFTIPLVHEQISAILINI